MVFVPWDVVMPLKNHIALLWNYGKLFFLLGALFNLVCVTTLSAFFSYSGLVFAVILKVLFTTAVWYLHHLLEGRDGIFFYINLGIGRKKLTVETLSADFLFLVFLLVVLVIWN